MTPTAPSPVTGHPHAPFWPPGVPHQIEVPDESLWQALARRAEATPNAVGLHFLGQPTTWRALHDEALALAGGLQSLGVGHGDRVILFMQNCPQFIVALHAALRIGAVVVPINPMNKADELGHYLQDAGALVALASSDIAAELARASVQPEAGHALQHLIVFDLADALPAQPTEQEADWPAAWQGWLRTRHPLPSVDGLRLTQHRWQDLLAQGHAVQPVTVRGDDLALLPYTSGTTGAAKGCLHTHATLMHNVVAARHWIDLREGDVTLVVVPMFHITGLVMGMLCSVRHDCAIVLLPRWDRRQALQAIQRHRVSYWPNIPTMVMDLLAEPSLAPQDLASVRYIGGGGAAMPDAVAAELEQTFGLRYIEGYGLTETAAPTHTNPPQAPRRHCLGIPYIGTKVRVIDPETLQPVPTNEVGEIVVRGPQVFHGYWRQPEATEKAFITLDGQRFFRTGDLGRVDADGYYYLADRLKRMINASGFKVWPAEVEALLHRHPAVQEACVIAVREAYRGESVKAVIVLRAGQEGRVRESDIIDWAREHMAAYKYPRHVEFVTSLPRNGAGKVLWRQLQARQDAIDAPPASTTSS